MGVETSMERDPQPMLDLADRVADILAEFGADEKLDGLAEQMGRVIAEFGPHEEK